VAFAASVSRSPSPVRAHGTSSRRPSVRSKTDRPPPRLHLTSGAPGAGSDHAVRGPSSLGIGFESPPPPYSPCAFTPEDRPKSTFLGLRMPTTASWSVLAVSHHLDELHHTRAPSILQPGNGHGVRRVGLRTPPRQSPRGQSRGVRGDEPHRYTLQRFSLAGSCTSSPRPLPSCRSSHPHRGEDASLRCGVATAGTDSAHVDLDLQACAAEAAQRGSRRRGVAT
jgi:hypothetical protein